MGRKAWKFFKSVFIWEESKVAGPRQQIVTLYLLRFIAVFEFSVFGWNGLKDGGLFVMENDPTGRGRLALALFFAPLLLAFGASLFFSLKSLIVGFTHRGIFLIIYVPSTIGAFWLCCLTNNKADPFSAFLVAWHTAIIVIPLVLGIGHYNFRRFREELLTKIVH